MHKLLLHANDHDLRDVGEEEKEGDDGCWVQQRVAVDTQWRMRIHGHLWTDGPASSLTLLWH